MNGGGWICLDYDPRGYNAEYYTADSTHYDWMDFTLRCGNDRWFGDDGAFRAGESNKLYTYVFAVGSQGACRVVLYDRTSGGEAASDTVTR
jgi:hypothetical protein